MLSKELTFLRFSEVEPIPRPHGDVPGPGVGTHIPKPLVPEYRTKMDMEAFIVYCLQDFSATNGFPCLTPGRTGDICVNNNCHWSQSAIACTLRR